MSNREKAVQMLDNLPEYKIGYVVAFLQGLLADESDDDFCETLLNQYNQSADRGDFVSLEEAK